MSRLSAHGIPVPSLPQDLIRNLASQFSSKPLTKDVLPSLELATHEFFKNTASPPPETPPTFLVRTWRHLQNTPEEKPSKKETYRCSYNGTPAPETRSVLRCCGWADMCVRG